MFLVEDQKIAMTHGFVVQRERERVVEGVTRPFGGTARLSTSDASREIGRMSLAQRNLIIGIDTMMTRRLPCPETGRRIVAGAGPRGATLSVHRPVPKGQRVALKVHRPVPNGERSATTDIRGYDLRAPTRCERAASGTTVIAPALEGAPTHRASLIDIHVGRRSTAVAHRYAHGSPIHRGRSSICTWVADSARLAHRYPRGR
jgi:hypothetical protein